MKQYSVVQIGLGNRGITHIEGFVNHSDRLTIAGICDVLPERVKAVGTQFGIPEANWYTDAAQMVEKVRRISFPFAPCRMSGWRWWSWRRGIRSRRSAWKANGDLFGGSKADDEICEETGSGGGLPPA